MSASRPAGAVTAELEAIAMVRALLEGRTDDAQLIAQGAEHPHAVAFIAAGLAASALSQGQESVAPEQVLRRLTWDRAAQE